VASFVALLELITRIGPHCSELLVLLSEGLQLVELERASRGPYLLASGCR